jgi:hypothetical protein
MTTATAERPVGDALDKILTRTHRNSEEDVEIVLHPTLKDLLMGELSKDREHSPVRVTVTISEKDAATGLSTLTLNLTGYMHPMTRETVPVFVSVLANPDNIICCKKGLISGGLKADLERLSTPGKSAPDDSPSPWPHLDEMMTAETAKESKIDHE